MGLKAYSKLEKFTKKLNGRVPRNVSVVFSDAHLHARLHCIIQFN